jgi:hypothetical protein
VVEKKTENKRTSLLKRLVSRKERQSTWHEDLGETLVCLGVLALIAIIFTSLTTSNTDVKGHCSMSNIKLEDVSPGDCYSDSFGRYTCPVPQNIECDFDIKRLPVSYLITRSK